MDAHAGAHIADIAVAMATSRNHRMGMTASKKSGDALRHRCFFAVGARRTPKFCYAFAAVSPHDGVMDSLVLPWVNANTMSLFLSTLAQRHPDEFIVMVMDQAGSHRPRTRGSPEHAFGLASTLESRDQSGRTHLGRVARRGLCAGPSSMSSAREAPTSAGETCTSMTRAGTSAR